MIDRLKWHIKEIIAVLAFAQRVSKKPNTVFSWYFPYSVIGQLQRWSWSNINYDIVGTTPTKRYQICKINTVCYTVPRQRPHQG
jgi:hypothetical protein